MAGIHTIDSLLVYHSTRLSVTTPTVPSVEGS